MEYFLHHFPKMTKEESDFIHDILSWDSDKKTGFMLAKKLFEDDSK